MLVDSYVSVHNSISQPQTHISPIECGCRDAHQNLALLQRGERAFLDLRGMIGFAVDGITLAKYKSAR
jgi:hypothetical protein